MESENSLVNFSNVPGSSINQIISTSPGSESLIVEVLRGDAFCIENNFYPDVIKIDVEGFENEVIDGLEEVLPFVKILFVECQDLEKTSNILTQNCDYLNPTKVYYEKKIFSTKVKHYEDWIFVQKDFISYLERSDFKFDN